MRRSQSLGSGFIIDTAGIVVTIHVIENADEISVICPMMKVLRRHWP